MNSIPIVLNTQDRYMFESAVDTQGIREIMRNYSSRLVQSFYSQNALTISPFSSSLPSEDQVHLGVGMPVNLPYGSMEVLSEVPYAFPMTFHMLSKAEGGFQVQVNLMENDIFQRSMILIDFDPHIIMTHFSLNFGVSTVNRFGIMNTLIQAMLQELPVMLGYIVHWNTRNRIPYTLGEPREYNVLDDHTSPSTQNVGDIKSITNPRDNPTGITKRPHERAGHKRRLSSGEIIEISPTIVHQDEYVPDNQPKKLTR